jgi:hypothetical protein
VLLVFLVITSWQPYGIHEHTAPPSPSVLSMKPTRSTARVVERQNANEQTQMISPYLSTYLPTYLSERQNANH